MVQAEERIRPKREEAACGDVLTPVRIRPTKIGNIAVAHNAAPAKDSSVPPNELSGGSEQQSAAKEQSEIAHDMKTAPTAAGARRYSEPFIADGMNGIAHCLLLKRSDDEP
ncbi:hypothetical protein BRDID11002_59610 [Bradyrhizobium diazoefficiens]